MAQTYKMMLGTSGRQWEQLTVREDGTMMLYFHGTDRSVTTQVTLVEDGAWKGWLRSEGGSLYPGIESGKWNKMDDGRGLTADVVETTEPAEQAVIETTTDCTDCTDNHAEPEAIEENTNCTNYTNNEPVIVNPDCNATLSEREPLTIDRPRPRRQRKARKAVSATASRRNEGMAGIVAENGHGLHGDYDAAASSVGAEQKGDNGWLRSVGYLAAASVALLVIWQTGLIIPLGLLGLATSGFLK